MTYIPTQPLPRPQPFDSPVPGIELTEHDQWRLNCALELEMSGHAAAAACLRNKIPALRGIDWNTEIAPHLSRSVNWAELFKAHRGSVPSVLSNSTVPWARTLERIQEQFPRHKITAEFNGRIVVDAIIRTELFIPHDTDGSLDVSLENICACIANFPGIHCGPAPGGPSKWPL